MPNNSVEFEPNYSDLLKARFCKQYIPRLKEFLTDFDISQASEDENPKDSLGMGFLVKAYNEMDNKGQAPKLKANCKWKIEGVTEKEIYEAIEEFYAITAWKDEIEKVEGTGLKNKKEENTVSGQRDKLLEFLFNLKIDDSQDNIADTTMFAIADYYGFGLKTKQLGNLYQPFECVAYAYDIKKEQNEGKDGLYDYLNALRLFPNVRNAIIHPNIKLELEEKVRYHEFIIFTYIGYVLACRRIWKAFNYECITSHLRKYKDNKSYRDPEETAFFCPDYPKLFTIPSVSVEINIGPGPNVKVSGKDIEGNEIEVNTIFKDDNRYSISISRYKKYTITIDDGIHDPLPIEDELDYNAWFYCYKVNLPKEWYPSSKEYETLSEGTKLLIARVSKYVKEGVREDIKECIKQQFAELQPLIEYAVKEGKRTEELDNILEKLTLFANGYGKIEEIQSLIEESNQTIFEELKTLSSKMDELHDEMSTISDNVKTANENAQKAGDEGEKINRKLSNWERNMKRLWLAIIIIIAGYCLYRSCVNDIFTNVLWLRYWLLYILAAIILTYSSFRLLTNNWNPCKAIKEEGKLKYWIPCILAIVFGVSPFLLSYQSGKALAEQYDFIGKDSTSNQCVAQYLEDYLPNEEELVRSNLALYYVDIVGNLEKASEIANPMLEDMQKFKDGSLVAMYVLYNQQEISTLRGYLDTYSQYHGEDNPVYCDMKGVMLIDTLCKIRDVHQGREYLIKAIEKGNIDAYYNLGYLYSHDESTMEVVRQGRKAQNSYYDLPEAIELLRVASDFMPKASILLGDIYHDLLLNDSALFYYSKAVTETNEGNIYKIGLYKLGMIFDKKDYNANEPLLRAQRLKYPPAFIYPSVALNPDMNLLQSVINERGSISAFFYKSFQEKDHNRAIIFFKDAQKNGKNWTLKDMGIYQYIPPVVFDYIYIGEKKKALAVLQEYRVEAHFNDSFTDAVEQLIGSAIVKKDSIKGMELMRKSASDGCIYAEMYCLYKDTDSNINNPSYSNNLSRLHEISEIIPFGNVLESLLLIKAGRLKDAEKAAHMAMWNKHPAGALIFDFMPNKYYSDEINGIYNGIENASDSSLFVSLKLMEMSLRSTWTVKDRSLSTVCKLDCQNHIRNKEDFTNNFLFWSNIAITSGSINSLMVLLLQYERMVEKHLIDKSDETIDPLLRSILFRIQDTELREFDYYPPVYKKYVAWFLTNPNLVRPSHAKKIINTYWSEDFARLINKTNKKPGLLIHDRELGSFLIDDFNLLTEFTYFVGPYAFWIRFLGDTLQIFKHFYPLERGNDINQ